MEMLRLTPLGVNVDVDPIEFDGQFYTESLNMVPKIGGMERAFGYAEVFPGAPFPPYWAMYTPQLTVPYWIYGGRLKIGVVDGNGTHTDVTPAGWFDVDDNDLNGANLNGIAVFNSKRNDMAYWYDGIPGAIALTLPGLRAGTRYNVVRSYKYYLVGMGVEDGNGTFPDTLHWSDGADPGQVPSTWVPAADNEAGDNVLADSDGAIEDGLQLRDSFMIYKDNAVYEMSYIGGNSVFAFRKVFENRGILARHCVAEVKGTHIVLGRGDIYQHDGQNIRSIAEGKVRDTVFAGISDENYRNSFVVYEESLDEVWFGVPSQGNELPNVMIVWNVETEQWGYRTLANVDFAATGTVPAVGGLETWDDETLPWAGDSRSWTAQKQTNVEDSVLILNATDTKFYQANIGTTADGVDYSANVQLLAVSFGDPSVYKGVRRIWPRMNAPSEAVFRLELFDQADPRAPLERVEDVTFSMDDTRTGVAVNANVRYMGLRLTCDDSVTFDLQGFDVQYKKRGFF